MKFKYVAQLYTSYLLSSSSQSSALYQYRRAVLCCSNEQPSHRVIGYLVITYKSRFLSTSSQFRIQANGATYVVLPVIMVEEKQNMMTYILLLNLLPQSNPSHLYLLLLVKANQRVKQNFDGVGCMIFSWDSSSSPDTPLNLPSWLSFFHS